MLTVYVAHKFQGNLRNADRAEKLTALLNLHIEGAIFQCPWLPMVRHWPNNGATLERGMMLDLESVKRHDALIALSARVGGVQMEWDIATRKLYAAQLIDEIEMFYRGEDDIDQMLTRVDYHWHEIQKWVDGVRAELGRMGT